jgi:hypothetical protein
VYNNTQMKVIKMIFSFLALTIRNIVNAATPIDKARHIGVGEMTGNIYEGDPDQIIPNQGEVDYGDVDYGDVELDQGDIDALYSGAPMTQVLARRTGVPQAVVAKRFGPGSKLKHVKIPSVIVENGRIIQWATNQKLSGKIVELNVKRHVVASPYPTLQKTAVPVAGVATVSLNSADLVLLDPTCPKFTVPIIFVTIAASSLAAKAGGQYAIRVSGLTEDLGVIDQSVWTIERAKLNDAVRLTIFPWRRVKDAITPVLGMVTQIGPVAFVNPLVAGGPFSIVSPWLINNAVPAAVGASFTVEVTGCAVDETVTVRVPGRDSSEITHFERAFKLRMA